MASTPQSRLQFLNSCYLRPISQKNDKGKYIEVVPDALIYTVKNVDTMETTLKIVEKPTIDYFISKVPQKYHKFSVPFSDTEKVICYYKDRDRNICQRLGLLDEFYNSFRNGTNIFFMQKLMRHPNLYMADVNIEDRVKTQYILNHGLIAPKRYKVGFADIETDISNFKENFPNPNIAPCPINLISYIDRETKTIYSFILWDERVKDEIRDVVSNPSKFIAEYCDQQIIQANFEFKFKVYEKEFDLIKAFFETIHELKPDFVGWWNMGFDMPTIINRLKKLGLNMHQIAMIMCHPEVPDQFKQIKYIPDPKRFSFDVNEEDEDDEKEDNRSKNAKNRPHPSRLWDSCYIPGYTQFYDQMSNFSNLRKRKLLKSYRLDDIGQKYGGIGKIDLESYGYSIKDVNIKNFKLFLAYNIRDTFVQYAIEEKHHDVDVMVLFSGNSRVLKTHSSSITIKNEIMLDLWKSGEIIGNSITYDSHEQFQGAIVGRPELIELLGIKVNGKPSYIFENVIDLDASSLYPSLIITHNIFKSALYGRVTDIIVNGVNYGNGEGLFENIQTVDQSVFDICEMYFNLPSPEKIIMEIERNAAFEYNEKKRLIA